MIVTWLAQKARLWRGSYNRLAVIGRSGYARVRKSDSADVHGHTDCAMADVLPTPPEPGRALRGCCCGPLAANLL